MESAYNIHGVRVDVCCEHVEAAARIGEHLSAYVAAGESRAGPKIRVEIADAAVIYPVPLHAKRVLRYGRLRNYYLAEVSWFTDYFSTLRVSADGTEIKGNLSPETERELGLNFFVDLLFNLALFEALRFHGLYYLHAAAVVDQDGAAYLITGNAGSGKTSLTLSLLAAGFKFLSDDTVFMKLAGDSDVEVLGFARDLHVPVDLAAGSPLFQKFSSYPAHPVAGIAKRRVPNHLFKDIRLAGLTNPGFLLFPEMSPDGSQLIPLPMSEAMARLLPQSMSVTFHPRLAAAHLMALKRVIGHARAYRLRAGRELKGAPEQAKALVLAAKTGAGP